MKTGKAPYMPLKAKAIAMPIAAMASGIVQAEGTGGTFAELCVTNAQGVVAGYQDLEYLDTSVEKDGAIGVYDRAAGKFYTNAGNGAFSAKRP